MKVSVYGHVYLVRCSATGKLYVGQTIRPLAVRFRQHGRLWRGKTSALGAAIRRYGPASFTIELLEECASREALDAAEAAWIDRLDCLAPKGYSLRPGGGNRAPQSAESRLRQSETMRGRVLTPQHRQKISAALYRLPAPSPDREAHRSDAISAAMRGREISAEHRAAISRTRRGQPCPLETRLKLLGRTRPGGGLSRPGEANPNARLTWPRVAAIRLLAGEFTQGELARLSGVTQAHIGRIIRGIAWNLNRKPIP
jgi:group I intron endonuclease